MPNDEKIIEHIREIFSEFGIDRDPIEMWTDLKRLSPPSPPKKRQPKASPAVVTLQRQLQDKGVDIPLQRLRQALGTQAEHRQHQRQVLEKKARAAKKG